MNRDTAAEWSEQSPPQKNVLKNHGRLPRFIEFAPVAMAMFDTEMRYVSLSQRWRKEFGLGEGDLRGISHYDLLPNTPERWKAVHRRGLAGEVVTASEDRFERDGSLHWKHWEVRPWHYASGAVGGIVIFTEDITDRKRTEEALRESELLFRSTFEQAAVGMAHAGAGGRFLRVNDRLCEITGYSREELLQKSFADITHPDDIATGNDLQNEIMAGKASSHALEKRYIRKDGECIWVHVTISPVRDDQGRSLYTFGVVKEISDRKKLEENLREREESFRILTEAMPQMVWASDGSGKAYYLNSRWLDYTGQSLEEARNLGWLNALHPEDVPGTQEGWTWAVTTGRPYEVEYRIKGKDGQYRWFLSRGVPQREASGTIRNWIGTCTDIDDQKRQEQLLNSAKEAAEQATRAKSEFLANMSHEIRTPMTVFLAAVEYLLQIDENPERLHLLEMADLSAKRLRDLLDDILDFSRIEARKLDITEVEFDLRSWVKETVDMFALPAGQKKLRLELEVLPELAGKFIGDPGRLGQVLTNLIGNAVKFTHEGEIRVSVQAADGFLAFKVTDTGIGIPPEKLGLLFQSFSQVDSSLTRKYGGSGLGLAICKGLVELMGGEISARSRPGEGSEFTFTVPLKKAPEESSPPESVLVLPEKAISPLRILLVEDEPMIRDMLTTMLAKRGWLVESVRSGVEALERLAKEDFRIVMMDVQMPQMNGLEATRAIRLREERDARRTRIIGLTAHARHDLQQQCLEAGMDAVLIKPVQMKELFSVVEGCLSAL